MVFSKLKEIEKLQKEVNSLNDSLVTCKKSAKRELLKKQIKDLELKILNSKKVTDEFLAKYVTDTYKKIIIDHYYKIKKWEIAITLHITNQGDYNPDTYRRDIHRLLHKSYVSGKLLSIVLGN